MLLYILIISLSNFVSAQGGPKLPDPELASVVAVADPINMEGSADQNLLEIAVIMKTYHKDLIDGTSNNRNNYS